MRTDLLTRHTQKIWNIWWVRWILVLIVIYLARGRILRYATADAPIDGLVFRDAGYAWLHGAPLFGPNFLLHNESPFVYPPFAALTFTPLALFSEDFWPRFWCAVLAISLLGSLILLFRKHISHPIELGIIAFCVMLYSEPVRINFELGQLDMIMLFLVIIDLFCLMNTRYRGFLIGIAAGIKMTPCVFAIYYLFKKDWRGLIQSIIGFAFTVIVGAIFYPKDSVYFWTSLAFDSNRAVSPNYYRDQSIHGLLSRSFLDFHQLDLVKAPIFLVVVGAGVLMAWFFFKKGEMLLSVATLGLGLHLGMPVANYHHWTVVILVLPVIFGVRGWHLPRIGLALLLGASIYLRLRPWNILPPQRIDHLGDWIFFNQMGLAAIIAFLLVLISVLGYWLRRTKSHA
ncbi:MAG: glycosyltransferase family 87 protein [Corynebacterium sp.]|nr:glycosyltransferase family 87 protein [Corynebacterium sp.]